MSLPDSQLILYISATDFVPFYEEVGIFPSASPLFFQLADQTTPHIPVLDRAIRRDENAAVPVRFL